MKHSEKVCKKKVAYNKSDAQWQVKVRQIKTGIKGGYYKCQHGDHFHVTSWESPIHDGVWRKLRNATKRPNLR